MKPSGNDSNVGPNVQMPRVIFNRAVAQISVKSIIQSGWLLLFLGALFGGLYLRQQVWEATAPIRFRFDVSNALRIGTTVLGEAKEDAGRNTYGAEPVTWPEFFRGYVSLYDHEAAFSGDQEYGLDYVPLRLLVMSSWVKYTRETTPAGLGYTDDIAWPLLWFNTFMELIAAVLMFMLVDHWISIGPELGQPEFARQFVSDWRSICLTIVDESKWRAWAAALLLWFNPAVLLEAHGWPQWDVWILPFYLGALLLASKDRWFLAGLSLGVGCMFKGQLLLVVPVVMLWPLFLWRFGAMARILMGFAVGWLGVASPWLLPGSRPLSAVLSATIVSSLIAAGFFRKNNWLVWSAKIVAFIAILLPWINLHATQWNSIGMGIAIIVVGSSWWLPRTARPFWPATMGLTTLLLAASAFGGSWAWFEIGFQYGMRHFPKMANGAVDNLPAILAPLLGWNIQTEVFAIPLPFMSDPLPITVKVLLGSVFEICLILCAIGAAMHHRRRDSRVLIALIAPWILLFALNVQMHGRYLFWGAALGTVGVASSAGLTALNIVVSILSTAMIGQTLLEQNQEYAPQTLHFLQGTCPALGWTVLLIAGIYLFSAVWPVSKRVFAPIGVSTEGVDHHARDVKPVLE